MTGVGRGGQGSFGFKRAELFVILATVVKTQTYTDDKIAQN